MGRKTVSFTKKGISKLPTDKPVVYNILTEGGKSNYTGIAKRGRVQERLSEHLEEAKIPGTKIQIQQMSSIQEAEKKEARVIAKTEPKYNQRGK